MITILKIAGLSAILAAGAVSALEMPARQDVAAAPKLFQDRIVADAPADRPAPAAPVRLADASGNGFALPVERANKGDMAAAPRGGVAPAAAQQPAGCQGQTWPHVSADCIAATNGAAARKPVRTISLESRQAPNVSAVAKAR